LIASWNELLPAFENCFNLKALTLKFTLRCDRNCSICIENSLNDKTELLGLDLIEKAFLDIQDLDINFSLQGGEVMLYPEYCNKIYDLWRKINKFNIRTILVTNGFWGEDDNLINFVKNKLKPTILFVTTDKWHQEKIPVSSINKIIKEFEFVPEIYLAIIQICSKNFPYVGKDYSKLNLDYDKKDLEIINTDLCFRGRAEQFKSIDDIPEIKIYNNEEVVCNNMGLSITPDGVIRSNCSLETHGCKFGHISDTNLKDVYLNLNRPRMLYSGRMDYFGDICENINPLDEKWKNCKRKLDA
jgi:hypothetical protein